MLDDLRTPALLLDESIVERNCARMAERARTLGVALRPHLKTAKSTEVAQIATRGQSGAITVSTVAEAAWFAARGYRDILYAVGIVPAKIPALASIVREHGARIALIVDDCGTAIAVGLAAADRATMFDMLIELDTGAGRGGVDPAGSALLELAAAIAGCPGLRLAGVLTHAGHGYHAESRDAIQAIAAAERDGAVHAARRLRDAGHPCPAVSVGSTPTILQVDHLEGVTEIRPGVYTLFDLDQVALGSCNESDIAISVLATVIGHNRRSGRLLVDAGALALSKDLSAAHARAAVGFGVVRSVPGGAEIPAGLHVAEVNQEHGLIAAATGEPPWAQLAIGTRVRILPNHACLTAAQYDRYHVIAPGDPTLRQWARCTGW